MAIDWEEKGREFREKGAVRLEGFLDAHWLAECRAKFDWSYENPTANGGAKKKDRVVYNDLTSLGTPLEKPKYEYFRDLVTNGPFADAAVKLWGGDPDTTRVWYYDHELFRKSYKPHVDGDPWHPRTRTDGAFHQDTSYMSANGPELVGYWICLDGFVPKENSLEIVAGSHLSPMFDACAFLPRDDTKGYFKMLGKDATKYELPPNPDIRALRAQGEVEVLSWDLNPGDVVALHSHTMHGAAPVSADFPFRRTLALRYFGEKMIYKELPAKPYGTPMAWLDTLKEGDPFWCANEGKLFPQVRGPAASAVDREPHSQALSWLPTGAVGSGSRWDGSFSLSPVQRGAKL